MSQYVKYDATPRFGGKRIPIIGCNYCAGDTDVVSAFGFGPTIFTHNDLHWLGDDAEEKARAYKTCPKCGHELIKGDRFIVGYICEKCHSKIASSDFCAVCGNGMAPHLFERLVKKGLHPIMA